MFGCLKCGNNSMQPIEKVWSDEKNGWIITKTRCTRCHIEKLAEKAAQRAFPEIKVVEGFPEDRMGYYFPDGRHGIIDEKGNIHEGKLPDKL